MKTRKSRKKKKNKEKDRIPQCGNKSFEEHRWAFYQSEKIVHQEVDFTWNVGKTIGLEAEEAENKIKKRLEDLIKEDGRQKQAEPQVGKRRHGKVN